MNCNNCANYNPKQVQQETKTVKQDIRIVVLQRGWVFVGVYSQKGMACKLENAKCIRTWGTTLGLGEIALGGPTQTTKLDPHGTVEFHKLTTICTVRCEVSKWLNALAS